MEFTQKEIDDAVVIEIKGEIMGANDSEAFKRALYDLVQSDKTNIVIDMKNATWMNSSGLGLLISGLTTIRSSGGDLRLANLSERLKRPMVITRLYNVFQSYDSVEAAVKSFSE